MIGWNFPSNNYGQSDGLNHPGIETFAGRPLWYLAREITQNSCDAEDKASGRPVEVEFTLIELGRGQFPDIDEFQKVLKACKAYWSTNKKASKFFSHAISVASEPVLRVLKISDYNTIGLGGPHDSPASDWYRLTKSVGASEKEGGGIGSFGIGKHAPFACSDLRTILYATKDKSGEFAFQGVSKLVTHERGRRGTTQGTGFYGHTARNTPIATAKEAAAAYRRKRIGADVFVAGFHKFPEWENEVAKSLLENFFVAIHEGRLIVRIGEAITLNQTSLPELIAKYQKSDPEFMASAYYAALEDASDVHVFHEDDFEGLGGIELRIVKNAAYKKRVAMVRGGMKIYDKGHFQTPMRFAGVFTARGEDLNSLLRSLEPPSHDDWQADRHEEPGYARGILKKMNNWINEKVRSLATVEDVQELDAEGLSQFLPDDLDDAPTPVENEAEGTPREPKTEIQVRIRDQKSYSVTEEAKGEPSGEGEDQGGGPGPGEGSNEGDGGEGQRGEGDAGAGGNGKTKPAATGSSTSRGPKIGLKNVRVYCTDPKTGRYRVLFEPESAGPGLLQIHVVGEVGDEIAQIKEVWLPGASAAAPPVAAGQVGPIEFKLNKRESFDIVLAEALHCALGVVAYAN